jgi:hypothetical protein
MSVRSEDDEPDEEYDRMLQEAMAQSRVTRGESSRAPLKQSSLASSFKRKADNLEPPDLDWINKVSCDYLKKRVAEWGGKPSKKNQAALQTWLKEHCTLKQKNHQPPESALNSAKKKKVSKGSDDASSKSSPKTEPLRRCWIYVIIDRRRNVIIYVGQSVDCDRRWKQHVRHAIAEDSETGLADFLAREQTTTAMLELKLVEGLPNGVAWKDADRFEAYFISKHKTVYDMHTNTRVCNKTNGNGAGKVDPVAIETELRRGYVWPEEAASPPPPSSQSVAGTSAQPSAGPVLSTSTAIVKVPTKLDLVQGLEACLMDAEAKLGQADAPLLWHGSGDDGKPGEVSLSMVTSDCDRLERGAYSHGTALCAKYEKMPPHHPVRRDEVVADIASFGEWAVEGDELHAEIKRQKVGLAPDKFVQFASTDDNGVAVPTVTARYASGAMMMMHARAGQFEEAGLRAGKDTRLGFLDLQRATAVREWMQAHDGAMPAVAAASHLGRRVDRSDLDSTTDEASLGRWLKSVKDAGGSRVAGACVILRDQPAALKYFVISRRANQLDRARALNALLRRGFGTKQEVEAGRARQTWTKLLTGRNDLQLLSLLYHGFLRGSSSSLAGVILEVGEELTEEGAALRRAEHEAGVQAEKDRSQKNYFGQKARRRENGMGRDEKDAKVLNEFLRKNYAHRLEAGASGDDQYVRLTTDVLGGTLAARRQLRLLGLFLKGGDAHIADDLLKELPAPRAAALRAQHKEAAGTKTAADTKADRLPNDVGYDSEGPSVGTERMDSAVESETDEEDASDGLMSSDED